MGKPSYQEIQTLSEEASNKTIVENVIEEPEEEGVTVSEEGYSEEIRARC
jgi:hypothetical protein